MTTFRPAIPTKRQCSLFKDQLSTQTSTYVHNYSVCPQTVWGHWSLSPSTHSHLDFFLLLCSPDSWCRRVTSGKRREAGSQNHTCIMSYTSLQLHRYWKVSGKDTFTQEPTKNKFKFRLILTWQKNERKKTKKQIRKMTLIPNKTADIQMTEKCCWNWSVAVQFSFVNQNRKKIYNVRKNLTLAPGKAAKSFCIKLVLWWIFPAGTNYSHLIHYGLLEFFLGKSCADGGIWFVKGKIT